MPTAAPKKAAPTTKPADEPRQVVPTHKPHQPQAEQETQE